MFLWWWNWPCPILKWISSCYGIINLGVLEVFVLDKLNSDGLLTPFVACLLLISKDITVSLSSHILCLVDHGVLLLFKGVVES